MDNVSTQDSNSANYLVKLTKELELHVFERPEQSYEEQSLTR
jgi:hypothetical protein